MQAYHNLPNAHITGLHFVIRQRTNFSYVELGLCAVFYRLAKAIEQCVLFSSFLILCVF